MGELVGGLLGQQIVDQIQRGVDLAVADQQVKTGADQVRIAGRPRQRLRHEAGGVANIVLLDGESTGQVGPGRRLGGENPLRSRHSFVGDGRIARKRALVERLRRCRSAADGRRRQRDADRHAADGSPKSCHP